MNYLMDPETKRELALLREEAERLGTNWETFAASYYQMRLDQFRIWLETGLRPDEVA